LQAFFNASELGAGFQIALSDLEIRGAGNILGAELHGHMAAVGFDLYNQLLSQAVEEERALRDGRAAVPPRVSTVIDLPIDAYLPDDYVSDEPHKLELYRRLGRTATASEVTTIRAELVDRFGALPTPVERLLEVAQLRITAEKAGIASLAREGHELVVRFAADWSRVATMKAMAPTSLTDRVPGVAPGGITYGSNQMRIRLPRDATAAWATTRSVVERLATRGQSSAA
jgi:transcription-repair coupling factor (superfamily II helicase)